MADDLDRAVLVQFDPSPNSASLKAQAAAYCESVKKSPRWWEIFVERFDATKYIEVKFWCLQTILELVPKNYANLDGSGKEKLRKAIVTWMSNPRSGELPEMLRNKLAQTVTAIVRLEFPKTWPSFFHDFIGMLDRGRSVVDMFCRVLLAIDSDIISLDIHRSVQEQKVSIQLKDTMRDTCIEAIVDAWYKLVVMYCTSDPELTTLVLQTLQKYISWMSVGLVVNNQFMPLLFDVLKINDEALQEASIDCLSEILMKGMEPSTKIHVVQKMGIVQCCATWKDGLPGGDGDDLREKCAKLLATLCSEILECWKRVENSCISMKACRIDIKSSAKIEANQICTNCEKMIDALFPAVMAVISIRDDEIAMAMVPFLSAYVLRLKHFQERVKMLPEKDTATIQQILSGVLLASRYPSESEIPPGCYKTASQRMSGMEEVESVTQKRRDLFTIFKNIVRMHRDGVICTLLDQLRITLQNPEAPFQDVEILITAVFELGEVQFAMLQETGCGSLAALVLPLIQNDIPNRHHQIVSLALLELYLRCAKVPLHHQQHLPTVISTFIGENGIRHSAEGVSDRACYLFMRFVKACRGAMKPFAMSILQSLENFFRATLTQPKQKQQSDQASTDPRLYVFEAMGLLLGIEDLDPEPQKEVLLSLLHPAIHSMSAAGEEEEWRLLQSLEMIIRISKGFKQDQIVTHRPELGQVFVKCMELALTIPGKCKSDAVFSRVVSFLHRMVELLGHVTLPYLQPAFEVLLQESRETARVIELVTLGHQLVTAFKESLTDFLTVVVPELLRRVWTALESDWDWTGRSRTLPFETGKISSTEGVVLDETREKEQLQHLYYGFICAMFSYCNPQSLLEIPADTIQSMLHTLDQGARLHAEIDMRRSCIQVFGQLVHRWSDQIKVDDRLRTYIIDTVGNELCLQSLFRHVLDVTDANSNVYLQDLATCVHAIFVVCGEAALVRWRSMLEAAQCPAEFGAELERQLRSGNMKSLKEFFKAIVKFTQR